MTDSMNEWVSRLSSETLPPLRRTLTRVKDLLGKPSANHVALSEVITFDPGFCLHILRQLHTLPHETREPITKPSTAIPILGMSEIEQAAHSLPALEDRLKGPPRRGLIDCYSRAAHASIYATGLAERRQESDPPAFATAALLHDLGEMMLWSQAPDKMREIVQLADQGSNRADAAQEILGFTLDELSHALGDRWQLPQLILDAQLPYNSYQPSPLSVMLACAVADTSAKNWRNQQTLENLELVADFLGLTYDQVQAIFHQYAAQAAQELHILPLPLPAFHLIPASNRVGTVKPTEPKLEAKPKPVTTRIQQKTEKALQPPQVETTRPKPAQTPASPTTSLHDQLTETIQEMRELYGLQNIMFAMLSSDRKQLKARFVVENIQEEKLKGFTTSLHKPSLFVALLKKPQALWVNTKNVQKYLPMIPDGNKDSLCAQGFLIMSIFIRNKPIGLFYADNGWGKDQLTADQYNNFKVVCQRFMQKVA